jgi:hypothetical protein
MKFKIVSLTVFVLMALVAFGTPNFAQVAPGAPPTQPVPPAAIHLDQFSADSGLNGEALTVSLDKLKVKLKKLYIKLKGLDTSQLTLSMNELGNDLKLNLDHVDLSANLSALTSDLNLQLRDLEMNSADNLNKDNESQSNNEEDELQSGQIEVNSAERIKTYSKSYSIDANDKLRIDNRYGRVVVNTWNKNMVKVDIEIKAESNNDTNAQKLLDAVQIEDGKEGDLVSFVTKINSDWGSGSFNWRGLTKIRKIEVNYTIYMPSKMPLDVTNRYGATELPDMEGQVVVNSSYGSLMAKSLSNANNQIRVSYGSANIASLTSSDINVSYGSLDLGKVDHINANVSYGSAKIGRINASGNISIRYSSPLQINDLDRGVKSLSVNCSYSGVKVGLSGDESADFDVTVKNGSFNYNDNVSITSKTPPDNARGWSPTKNYKGHVGKGSNEKMITITSAYGTVNFD